METGNELDERCCCRKAPKLISLSDCCNRFSSPSLLCASPLLSVLRLANVVCGGGVWWPLWWRFFCFQHQVLIIPDNGISVLNLQTSRIMPHTHCFLLNVKRLAGDSTFCKSLATEYATPQNILFCFVLPFAVRRIDEKR